MTDERLLYATRFIPMYELGEFNYVRHFGARQVAELAGDFKMLTAVEAEFERQARRAAAEKSLTVLKARPAKWRDVGPGQRVLEVTYSVRHEPQTDDQLIYDVYARLARDPALWAGGIPNPQTLARAAVEAVRDLGRLTATLPRPDGIPE